MEVYSLLFLHQLSNCSYEMLVDGYDYRGRCLETGRGGVYRSSGPVLDQYQNILVQKLFNSINNPANSNLLSVPEALKPNANFFYHDISSFALPRKYQIIMCAHVLYHHLGKLPPQSTLNTILDNLAASLEPGGFLVCENVNAFVDLEGAYDTILRQHPLLIPHDHLAIPFHNHHRVKGSARILQLK